MMKLSIIIILLFSLFFVNIVSSEETVNIIFSEPEYNQGDIVTVTVFASSDRGITIEEFYVEAEYDAYGVSYVEDLDGKYFSSNGNSASFDFRAARANTMVTVNVWAFNGFHDEGGIPVAMETSQVFINDVVYDKLNEGDKQFSDEESTPGFELFCFVFSIGVVYIILKKRD